MVSTWSSGSTMLRNSYENQMQMDTQFTFIDFLPECQESGGIFSSPKYENFRILVDRGNDWLRANPQWKIITCESVEFKNRGDKINYEKMVYLESGEASTWYVRGLRLWITKRRSGEEKEQQIGYINLVPEVQSEGGVFSRPSFESLDELIQRFNTMIQTHPIPGRIITIESQEMKLKRSADIEPDRSSWKEEGSMQKHFLFVIRVFFEICDGESEEIGLYDFMPNIIKNGGIVSLPKYEPFSEVVKKASAWCARQNSIRVCNTQSLEVKVKTGQEVDTQKMDYTEHGNRASFYVRILRIAYTKSQESKLNEKSKILTELTCKTFVPVQLTTGIFIPEFETLLETKHRISEWIRATGVQVGSAETVALRILTGKEAKQGTEASFTHNRAERDEYWIFAIRLYINGSYQEPPTEMLPPIPEIEQKCCTII